MAIRPIVIDRKPSAGYALSISKSRITLSAKFIKDKEFSDYEGIVFYRDDEDDYWLGFALVQENNQSDSLGLVATTSAASRYVKAAEIINKTPVQSHIQGLEYKADRTFEIQWDKNNKLWFIRLRPVFERAALWSDRNLIPDEVMGIYRYWAKNGDLLYIGKGWIKARTNSPERQEWAIHKVEYSILKNDDESLRWESFYLEEHKNRYGVLPPYNRISGHSNQRESLELIDPTNTKRGLFQRNSEGSWNELEPQLSRPSGEGRGYPGRGPGGVPRVPTGPAVEPRQRGLGAGLNQ